ncbi:DUF2125 domain-containing protein [Aestuariicoccus sp. MJ-SS9]|uniref:DUF2125 domain-containing protein n=1 Tax=Aestuariicoccus sp. MJ-SS9 TaxID=3079855 RepID=UPI002913003E|nr:DUF2125 domain-containing protein [Aestuariicoccus sp. MJ-SS9]MDU8912730.1 DUF2125 domain-containing protein [Aestuariicoccus sp. MJ-SS9]
MTRQFACFSSTALALGLMANTVAAEVTPADVWGDITAYVQGFGYSVMATETAEGSDLQVTDAVISMTLPEDEGEVSFSMSEVLLSDAGDGTVRVTFPASMPIAVNVTPDGEDPVDVVMDYTQEGLDMVVSGDPGAMVYSYTADSLGLVLSGLTVDGVPIPAEVARFALSSGPVEGRSAVTLSGGMREIDQSVTVGAVTYDMAFNDPDSGDSGTFTGQMTGLAIAGTGKMPQIVTPEMLADMMAMGVEGSGTFTHQGGQMQFSATDGGEVTQGQTSSQSGSLAVDVTADSLRYSIGGTGLSVSLSGGEIPLPVDVAMAEMGLTLELPTAASDTPEDIALAVTLGGFTMSDLLWNIFDPGNVLPRDPATVAFDLAGMVTPFISLYDTEALAQLEQTGGVPGELNALTLKGLTVEAAGVSLTGTGDFTFDNSDLESFDGLPKPTGAVNLNLSGANALIDKLIQMGLLAEEDAMGPRMMMGMFAVPGDGPDELKSTLEINEQGHILANGQRIQ